jgi:hypothetical protein
MAENFLKGLKVGRKDRVGSQESGIGKQKSGIRNQESEETFDPGLWWMFGL